MGDDIDASDMMYGHGGSGLPGRITLVCYSLNIAATMLLYAESVVAIVPHRHHMALLSVPPQGSRRVPSDKR